MSRSRIVAVGVDPDSSYSGLALAACTLPLGATRAEDLEVLRVACTDCTGLDARGRLPEMARQLRAALADLMDLSDPDVIVVEAQAHRPGDPRPDNIVQLAAVEGMAAGAAWALAVALRGDHDGFELRLPLPVEWKGSMPKARHQAGVLRRLGLTSSLSGVCGADALRASHRNHVVDAIGLATWGLDKMVFEERKRRILS